MLVDQIEQFFGDLVKHSADYNNIPAAALTHYWFRHFSVTLHNALANSFFKRLGRANARAFRDESRDAESSLSSHTQDLHLFLTDAVSTPKL
jgi:hypothetical protein